MKIKTGLSVLLSAGLILSMITPCFAEEETAAETVSASAEIVSESAAGSVTAESLIDRHLQKCEEGVSVSGEENIALSMKMAVFGETMSIKMNMHFDIETVEDTSHLTGEMNMAQESASEEDNAEENLQTEIYAVKEDDGSYTVYTRDSESDAWSKSVLDEMEFAMDLTRLVKGNSFELSEDTVSLDGTECYEVKTTMSLRDMMEYLGSSMEEGLDEILPVGDEADAEAYALDVLYYFDVESLDLFSMKMDGAAMLEKLFKDAFAKSFSEMGSGAEGEDPGFDVDALMALFKIEIPDFLVEVNNIRFDTVESIEIPEEALAAEMDLDEDDRDEDENGPSVIADDTILFDGMTVIDNEECSIVLEDIDPNDTWGYTIHAELENKSPDKKLMFSVDNGYVNGVENDPYFAAEVAPGKKAKESISFEKMDEYGLVDFSDIEMSFQVYDSEDWSADPVGEETVHIYPHGEDSAEPFVYEPADTDQVLYDDDSVSFIFTGVDEEDTWGYTLNLFITNKTDSKLMISADDVSVNGYMLEPYFSQVLGPGKSAFTGMSWSYSDLEESGIDEAEEVEFTLTASDYDDWTSDDIIHQLITVNVKE